MSTTFRIHPALGIARVGNADDGFIGPEFQGVPANWNFETAAFDPFKVDGRIKRQGVRFRVFEYAEDGTLLGETLGGQGGVAAIRWTVHVANRKAAFFQFDGASGEDGNYTENGIRNEAVTGAARTTLEIDPGPKSVSGISASPVLLSNPNPQTNDTIKDLGDIRTDDAGRLVFFGGHGETVQLPGAPDIDNYVNNDGWLDDVSDGPVTAVIEFQDGREIDALGAWVSVGPPDFAPGIANVVTLYEMIWDILVRHPSIPISSLAVFRSGGSLARLQEQRDDWDPVTNRFRTYQPSFSDDIAYVFHRAFSATFVHNPPDLNKPFHNTIGHQVWADLGDPDPAKDGLRQHAFARIRDPNAPGPADSRQMPRGLGDEYCDEEENPSGSPGRTNPRRFFSLTRVQYALMTQWVDRNFKPDGTEPAATPVARPEVTPDGLDRAVLENCVGGPFFPGIEVGWVIRNPKIYMEPFRLQPGVKVATGDPIKGIPDVTVRPGFLTQQMALPWQADFRDCKRESLTNTHTGAETWAMWWAGQRPDDVFTEDDPARQIPWARRPHFDPDNQGKKHYEEMVRFWSTLGFVVKPDPNDKRRWLETERS